MADNNKTDGQNELKVSMTVEPGESPWSILEHLEDNLGTIKNVSGTLDPTKEVTLVVTITVPCKSTSAPTA